MSNTVGVKQDSARHRMTGPTATERKSAEARTASEGVAPAAAGYDGSEQVWQALAKASFAVLGYVTPSGEPRSSGVVYKTVGRRLYVAVAPDSWKAKHVAASGRVSVTVPVRRAASCRSFFPFRPQPSASTGRRSCTRPARHRFARSPRSWRLCCLPRGRPPPPSSRSPPRARSSLTAWASR